MAHQLDFQVTVWVEDKDDIIDLEQIARSSAASGRVLSFLAFLISEVLDNERKLEMGGIDINWDDDAEEDEPEL